MKKLGYNSFLPEIGEILQFEDLYGKPAGSGMSQWVVFGGSNKPNPGAICIKLEPFTKTETKFLVSANSLMTNIMGGPRVLIVSTKPWAEPGDPENVAEMKYGNGELNGSLLFFVNSIDEPPQGITYTSGYGLDENGKRVMIQKEADAGVWLKPHTQYYITYKRLNQPAEATFAQTLSLYVVATDNPQQGGEVVLAAPVPTSELPMEEISLGGRSGLVLWDDA